MLRNATGAGLRTVRGPERIHHEHVAQCGHLPRQFIVAGLLTHEKTHVLEQHDLARLDAYAVDPVGNQRDIGAKQFAEALGNGFQRKAGFRRTFGGSTEV